MLFWIVFIFVVIQRLLELMLANRNEQWMKSQGAIEYGHSHYVYMVLMHISFFISLIVEVIFNNKSVHPYWVILLFIFLIIQTARIWVILSLGKYWNTKIIVLPGSNIVSKGPFQLIKHPNYLIVTIELIILPLMFQAYLTMIAFFFLNQIILAIRIPIEEQALRENTDY
ncbi:isoprenylcysteine carboxyl methyltransferase family protein [Lederbergia lenta]|uniref:isoprenylcysteine carboxyl methyltransferase family protein n=1 Tax=Lederbergia lenta TaxID=1467 RepID=UPI00203E4404|nr:isoprenylcysteine carboxylmethyltransferase family protein [Lederbergia lenta]MCM3109323.1 hypothetical protein [Lederbergia lenta]